MSDFNDVTADVIPKDPEKINKILKVSAIIAVLAILQVVLAFLLPRGGFSYTMIVFLMVAKAYYITAELMHLKNEVKVLIGSILIPILFIVFFLFVLYMEGNSIVAKLY
ncbi:MAG: cytochrome C oxidase subunit IV family protein [Cyclobacteriaceae bacterium]|nr:cytochrome C oxidase subunit IV family protein [Cyclobacteriaceae bacterium]MCH8515167.1 cytochrome C oxidase subunit IV family protein [Cyclobacteriaceae bacterium]